MPASVGALEIIIGTGEVKTFSHFSGRIIERIINRNVAEITCKTLPASGDMHNLTNLKQGSLDLALIDSRMLYDAVTKQGNFKFLDIAYDDLRVLLPICNRPMALVVRSDADIEVLDDVAGKRINAGAPRSPQRLVTATIMGAKKWSKADFSLFAEISSSLSQDIMAFCHGTVEAMVHMGVHPDSTVQQLLQRCDARLVAMDDMDLQQLAANNPGFIMSDIAPETYPMQPQPIQTVGTQTLLVASEILDENAVYAIIEALYDHRERLTHAHPALTLKPVDASQTSIAGTRLHPGAVRYFSGQ
jgi:TRAP transporter TAXI family solute receptor